MTLRERAMAHEWGVAPYRPEEKNRRNSRFQRTGEQNERGKKNIRHKTASSCRRRRGSSTVHSTKSTCTRIFMSCPVRIWSHLFRSRRRRFSPFVFPIRVLIYFSPLLCPTFPSAPLPSSYPSSLPLPLSFHGPSVGRLLRPPPVK